MAPLQVVVSGSEQGEAERVPVKTRWVTAPQVPTPEPATRLARHPAPWRPKVLGPWTQPRVSWAVTVGVQPTPTVVGPQRSLTES